MTVLPPGAPNICIKLLDQRLSGKLTEAQFETELAFVMLEPICFNELKPKPYPSKPFLMGEYQKKTPLEKMKVSDDFWRRPDIDLYLNQKQRVKNENKTNSDTLKDLQKKIPAGDSPNQAKIRNRILEFEVFSYELR